MHTGFYFVGKPLRRSKGLAVSVSSSRRVHPSVGSSCRERIPVLDQQKFGRVDQGEKRHFRLREDKRRRNRLSPAKRRVAGIGGVIPRPEESQPTRPCFQRFRLPWASGASLPEAKMRT